jgi:ABC-type amino acid transport substrate-binding protein
VAAVDATVLDPKAEKLEPISGPASEGGIRSRGVLRVGYADREAPFGYINDAGDLVGYDVSYAYQLARDLHVRLEFVPLEWGTVRDDLGRHMFDIVMAGTYANGDRLRHLVLTNPYLTSPVSLMVQSAKVDEYLDYRTIAERDGLTLGAVSAPDLAPFLKFLFPKATIHTAGTYGELLQRPEIDAVIGSLEQARTWAKTHSGYTAVMPKEMGAPFVFVYLLPPDSGHFSLFVNEWMKLKTNDGFRQQQLDYWLKGEPRALPHPRWNLLDAVLAR